MEQARDLAGELPLRQQARRVLLAPAPHEVILVVYLCYLSLRMWVAPPGDERTVLLTIVGATLTAYVAMLLVCRGAELTGWRRFVLRTSPLWAIFGPYAFLPRIIPLANPATRDLELYRLDLALFGFEPSIALEPVTTRPLVEWMSCFYMSYWVITLVFILGMMTVGERRRAMRFAASIVLTVLVGHVMYIAVPGFGPYRALEFAGPLPGGPAYDLMMRIAAAGAQRDIFPSLHTGHLLLLLLFCVAERRESRVLRWAIWPLAFVLANIVAATLVLRWHYLVDVFAGVAVALFCHCVGRYWTARWEQARAQAGLVPIVW